MIFPKFNNMDIIDKIREKYDPLASHVRPHITFVFPFSSEIESSELKNHLNNALSSVKSFRIVLKDITPLKSFGNYLFLNIENGKDEIIEIHERLYTDILESYFPKWLKSGGYYPHMTVGKIESEEEYKSAIEDTKEINDVFDTIVSKVSVEIIDENEDSVIEMEIELG
jgi:2'-5' RNA ligase